jgi:signal transduction histidine kinase
MIDTGQLLERFRQLSRDIQIGLQSSQKQIEHLKAAASKSDIDKLSNTLNHISEAWQDFSGWILVSTIDNLSEARSNCAPGRVDISSKITRSTVRRKNELARMGIKVDTSDVKPLVVETFIPYFEQLLDLLFGNAIKYSPKAGVIEISNNSGQRGATLCLRSIGPLVTKTETPQLGEKGFRSEHARNLELTGQGYGLYNCKRLAELLGIDIDFRPDYKILYESGGVSYANFNVVLRIPDSPPAVAPERL